MNCLVNIYLQYHEGKEHFVTLNNQLDENTEILLINVYFEERPLLVICNSFALTSLANITQCYINQNSSL